MTCIRIRANELDRPVASVVSTIRAGVNVPSTRSTVARAASYTANTSVSGALATGPELGLAVSNVRSAADRVPEIELIRPSHVQHKVADGVGLRVGTPPQVVLAYRIETGANLPGKLVEHSVPDHLQKLSIEGCVVHRAQ